MDEGDKAPLDGAPFDEHAATARRAAEPEVGAQPVHVPGPAAAGMRTAELETVTDAKGNGGGHARGGTSIGREGSTRAGAVAVGLRSPWRPAYGRGFPSVGTRIRSVAGTTMPSSGVTSTSAE